MSYAAIAGLPAAQGLFTGFVAPLAYAVFGASPQLIVGPTAIMCILTDAAIPEMWGGAQVQPGSAPTPTALRVQLAALLALSVAFIQAVMAATRLGGLVSLISLPVVAGFTSGSALLTAASQASTLLGLPKCTPADGIGAGGASCSALDEAVFIAKNFKHIHWAVVGISAAAIALLIAFKYGLPRLVPPRFHLVSSLGPLALVVATAPLMAAYASQLEAVGVDAPKPIPAGLPAPSLPFLGDDVARGSAGDWFGLLVAAAPLAVIGFMGGVTIAATAARQAGLGRDAVDAAAELRGQAFANLACAVGHGLPITGSFSRTAVNSASGAVSGAAGAMSGALMAVALTTATGILANVPTPARAAVVIVAIYKMMEPSLALVLWRADVADAAVFALTFAVVACTTAPIGLVTGIVAQWLVALSRGVLSPVPVELWGLGRSVTTRAAKDESAVVPAPAWERRVAFSADAAAVATSGDGKSGDVVAAVLRLSPDVQFFHGGRLGNAVAEAAHTYKPAALLLDCRAVASADGTGARALLSAASDAAAVMGAGTEAQPPPLILAFSVSPAVAATLTATAAALEGDRDHRVATPSALSQAPGAIAAGALWIVPRAVDAHRVARAACLLRLAHFNGQADATTWISRGGTVAVAATKAEGDGRSDEGISRPRVVVIPLSRVGQRITARRRARAPFIVRTQQLDDEGDMLTFSQPSSSSQLQRDLLGDENGTRNTGAASAMCCAPMASLRDALRDDAPLLAAVDDDDVDVPVLNPVSRY